jgi:hypothetical protein
MKNRFLGAALAALLSTTAIAQVNVVPQIGLNTANLRQNTYTAAIKGIIPAASTTDFFCISAGTSKTVKIQHIELSGSGTIGSSPVYLMHNSILDTGTAAVVGTYGPVAYKLNSSNPAATATVVAYNTTGGNPTIGGTATLFRSGNLTISPTATTTFAQDRLVWKFGTSNGFYNQQLTIPAGSTEQICLNGAASSLTAVLQGFIEWTEE